MTENDLSGTPSLPDIQRRLAEVAALLRDSTALDAEARAVLAELVQELSGNLAGAPMASDQLTHLAGTTTHLAEALHHRRDPRRVAAWRERFEDAVNRAEVDYPVTVGVARRLLDVLANMGI